MRSGVCSPASCATAAAPTHPARLSPASTTNTLAAPYSPSAGATVAASGPTYTHSTSPSSRALVTSSSVAVVGLSPSDSAYTQIFMMSLSDDLEPVEELDDLLERGAVVLDLLARLTRRRGGDRGDRL